MHHNFDSDKYSIWQHEAFFTVNLKTELLKLVRLFSIQRMAVLLWKLNHFTLMLIMSWDSWLLQQMGKKSSLKGSIFMCLLIQTWIRYWHLCQKISHHMWKLYWLSSLLNKNISLTDTLTRAKHGYIYIVQYKPLWSIIGTYAQKSPGSVHAFS